MVAPVFLEWPGESRAVGRCHPSCPRGGGQAGELTVDVPAEIPLDRPRSREHGDYATPVALKLAKIAGRPPREIAGVISKHLTGNGRYRRRRDRRAGLSEHHPGHRGRRPRWSARSSRPVQAYGDGDALAGQRVNLEFVSANPTGPMHIGGARWAAVGDALGRVLSTQGADRGPGVLLQRRRRADRPVRPVAAGRRPRAAGARGRLRRRLHRRDRRPDHRRAPGRTGAARRRRRCRAVPARGHRADVRRDQGDAAPVPDRFRRLLPRELAARERRGDDRRRAAQGLRAT